MRQLPVLFDSIFATPQYTNEWSEQDGKLVLEVDLPGMKKEDINISNQGNMLVIEAKRHFKNNNIQSSSEYRNMFSIPRGVNRETFSAEYENGVLRIIAEKVKLESNKILIK